MTELSTDEFQAAVARFPSGVAVVTVDSDDGPVSLATRAFSAVSSEPPLVMVCIPRSAGSFKEFQWAQAFGVSILAITQVELARQFATGGAGDVRSVRIVSGPSATARLIEGAVAHLEETVRLESKPAPLPPSEEEREKLLLAIGSGDGCLEVTAHAIWLARAERTAPGARPPGQVTLRPCRNGPHGARGQRRAPGGGPRPWRHRPGRGDL